MRSFSWICVLWFFSFSPALANQDRLSECLGFRIEVQLFDQSKVNVTSEVWQKVAKQIENIEMFNPVGSVAGGDGAPRVQEEVNYKALVATDAAGNLLGTLVMTVDYSQKALFVESIMVKEDLSSKWKDATILHLLMDVRSWAGPPEVSSEVQIEFVFSRMTDKEDYETMVLLKFAGFRPVEGQYPLFVYNPYLPVKLPNFQARPPTTFKGPFSFDFQPITCNWEAHELFYHNPWPVGALEDLVNLNGAVYLPVIANDGPWGSHAGHALYVGLAERKEIAVIDFAPMPGMDSYTFLQTIAESLIENVQGSTIYNQVSFNVWDKDIAALRALSDAGFFVHNSVNRTSYVNGVKGEEVFYRMVYRANP